MIYPVDHIIAGIQYRIDISAPAHFMGAQVPLIVSAHRAEAFPVVLGMDKDRVVFRGAEIQHRLQDFIFYFDQFHRFFHGFFRRPGNDRRRVAHETHPLVKDQPVVRAGLRIGLPCHCKALVRTVLIGKDTLDPGNRFCPRGIDLPDQRMGMRAPEHFHDQAV